MSLPLLWCLPVLPRSPLLCVTRRCGGRPQDSRSLRSKDASTVGMTVGTGGSQFAGPVHFTLLLHGLCRSYRFATARRESRPI